MQETGFNEFAPRAPDLHPSSPRARNLEEDRVRALLIARRDYITAIFKSSKGWRFAPGFFEVADAQSVPASQSWAGTLQPRTPPLSTRL